MRSSRKAGGRGGGQRWGTQMNGLPREHSGWHQSSQGGSRAKEGASHSPPSGPQCHRGLQALAGLLCAQTTPTLDRGGFNCLFIEPVSNTILNPPGLSILGSPCSKVEKTPWDHLRAPGPSASEWLTPFYGRMRNSSQRKEHMGVTIGHPFSENNSFGINYLFAFPVHLAFKLPHWDRVRNLSKQSNDFGLLRVWARGQAGCTCCAHWWKPLTGKHQATGCSGPSLLFREQKAVRSPRVPRTVLRSSFREGGFGLQACRQHKGISSSSAQWVPRLSCFVTGFISETEFTKVFATVSKDGAACCSLPSLCFHGDKASVWILSNIWASRWGIWAIIPVKASWALGHLELLASQPLNDHLFYLKRSCRLGLPLAQIPPVEPVEGDTKAFYCYNVADVHLGAKLLRTIQSLFAYIWLHVPSANTESTLTSSFSIVFMIWLDWKKWKFLSSRG